MPELRKNPITHQWTIIATERSRRPDSFPKDSPTPPVGKDPFAEGGEKATTPELFAIRKPGTKPNTPGWKVRVISNMFPIVGGPGKLQRKKLGLYETSVGVGAHELVITRDPEKDEAQMSVAELDELLGVFQYRYRAIARRREIQYIQIFKNHKAAGGASLRHPHHQIVGTPFVANDAHREVEGFREFHKKNKKHALATIVAQEKRQKVRMVYENKLVVVFCPYFSENPFEMWITPKKPEPHFEKTSDAVRRACADALQCALGKLRNTLHDPGLNYMIHTAPCDERRHPTFHWHIQILPRIIIRAGFELGTGLMVNIVSPEDAAKYLRKASRKAK